MEALAAQLAPGCTGCAVEILPASEMEILPA